jgi:hypothetical protein
MTLNTVPGIIAEQARVYRLWTNGKIRSGEMSQAMFGLKEIRHSIESLPPEPVNPTPTQFTVVEVEPGFFLDEAAIRAQRGFGPLKIVEHTQKPEPAQIAAPLPHNPEPEFEPRTERERQLLAELEALSPEQLLARAKEAGYVDADSV